MSFEERIELNSGLLVECDEETSEVKQYQEVAPADTSVEKPLEYVVFSSGSSQVLRGSFDTERLRNEMVRERIRSRLQEH